MAQSNESLFYHFIRMAYDYTSSVASEPIDGDRLAVITRLYQQRLSYIIQDLVFENPSTAVDLSMMYNWFLDTRRKKEDEILSGRIDQFQTQPSSADTFQKHGAALVNDFEKDETAGQLTELGSDAYATYLPIHFFPNYEQLSANWGIYISEFGVMKLAAVLRRDCIECFGTPKEEMEHLFTEIAYQILLRHELEHFKIEAFALNAELILSRAVYVPYLTYVYAETYCTDACLEEALANRTVLDSVKIRKLFEELYPALKGRPGAWARVIADRFLDHQPPGYRNYHLNYWWRDERRHSAERREAMNHLCNQILEGNKHPIQIVPFYAFPPDNYFLRAENLVPIHIVKTLPDDDSFIQVATPSRTTWEKFLRSLDYGPTDRGKGDHVVWTSPYRGWPDLTLNYHKKDLDFNSFKSALKSLDISMPQFAKYRDCKELPSPLQERIVTARGAR